MKRKEIAFAFTTFNAGNPQYNLEIDETKAKQLGISVSISCRPCRSIMVAPSHLTQPFR